jgi:hypothetical protein
LSARAAPPLHRLTKRDACQEQLSKACRSNKEDKLKVAIDEARKQDVDCATAQQQLDALMQKRLSDSKLKEEARASLREKKQDDLQVLLADSECPIPELADATRHARNFGVEVSAATKVLHTRIAANLAAAVADDSKDLKRLLEAIKFAALLDNLGVTVDVHPAKRTIERWQKQSKLSKQLRRTAESVRKVADDRTICELEGLLEAAGQVLDTDAPALANATVALQEVCAALWFASPLHTALCCRSQPCAADSYCLQPYSAQSCAAHCICLQRCGLHRHPVAPRPNPRRHPTPLVSSQSNYSWLGALDATACRFACWFACRFACWFSVWLPAC